MLPAQFTRYLSLVTRDARGLRFTAMLALAILAAAPACSGPGYYLQATAGHWELLRSRQDIADVMADPDSDPDLVRKLRTAREILRFADDMLGLPAGDSYADFVATDRTAVAWNVVAAPEFSVTAKQWCFVVAGCVPYRGYFDEARARQEAGRLAAKGMDVAVTPVTAYSTLGWFRDPLLDTMINRPDTFLAAALIHELAHRRLYLKGETEFSESYASFVERAGVETWLEANGRADELEKWRAYAAAAGTFNRLLRNTRDRLAALYAAAMPEPDMRTAKAGILGDLRTRYERIRDAGRNGEDYFSGFFARELNNAHLALAFSYEGGQCAFSRLLHEAGGDFHEFNRLAEARAKLERSALKSWLNQRCGGIAPNGDM